MHWRELLAAIGLCEAPVSELVRASADRSGLVNRRAFLGLAGAAVAGLAIDPEALLWTPGEKTILLPAAPRLNTLVSVDWLTKEMLRVLEANLAMVKHVNRLYDLPWQGEAKRIGDTVHVRTPVRFKVQHDDKPPSLRLYERPSKPVTMTDQLNVAMQFTPEMRRLSREDVRVRMIEPAAAALAEKVRERKLTVFADLPMPHDVEAARVASSSGLSVRGIQAPVFVDTGRTILTQETIRFDLLGGRG